MKTQKFKRTLSLFLAMLMCVTTLFGMGTTAFAAEETDEVYLISYPRDGDANYGGEWGHNSLSFMNGWSTATSRFTTIRAMGSYEGNICYCIEPGVPQQTGNTFTKKGEDFWDYYPSFYNSTISPDDIKLFIGRIFQYGYNLNVWIPTNICFDVLSKQKLRNVCCISEIGDDIAFYARITQKQLSRFIIVIVVGVGKRENVLFNQSGISIGFGITVKQIVYCRLIDWELVLITQRIKYFIKIGFVFTDVTNVTFLRVDNADL